jgi:hypothetical protein
LSSHVSHAAIAGDAGATTRAVMVSVRAAAVAAILVIARLLQVPSIVMGGSSFTGVV